MGRLILGKIVSDLENLDFENKPFTPLSENEINEILYQISKDEMFFDDDAEDDIEAGGQIVAAIENLEHVANVISAKGISGPMMMLADPNNELIAAGAIKGDYESMSDIPVIGEESLAALEGIRDVIKSIGDKFKSIFEHIRKQRYEKSVSRTKIFSKFDVLLTDINNKMKNTHNVDEAILKDRMVRALSKRDYDKLASCFDRVIGKLTTSLITAMNGEVDKYFHDKNFDRETAKAAGDAIVKHLKGLNSPDLENTLGIVIDQSSDGHILMSTSSASLLKDSYASVGDLGWNKSSIEKAVAYGSKLKANVSKIEQFGAFLIKFVSNNDWASFWKNSHNDEDEKNFERMYADSSSVFYQYIRSVKSVLKVVDALYWIEQELYSSSYRLGEAYTKAGKK